MGDRAIATVDEIAVVTRKEDTARSALAQARMIGRIHPMRMIQVIIIYFMDLVIFDVFSLKEV